VNKRAFIALMLVLTGACAFLFNNFYKEAKNSAVTKLNEEQMIHAKQAAQGIEDFFATWTRDLSSLSKMDEIVDTDDVGKRYMKIFYEANQEQIGSITRLDERGVILYNLPQNSSAGTDISDQKHVRELLRDHKPVVSDVFRAVEGFDAVALHVPVFRGSVFKGSIGILINFEDLAKRYLDVIKIGETGYAWVVSRDGTQLYSPIPGFTGKSVFENIKGSPSLIVMVNDMLEGHEGTAIYTFDTTGGRNAGQVREYAVYMPVHVGNTFWSIAVASAEQDVLSGLISFRNKLILAIGALFICGMVFSILGAKAWFIVKEEEKRKRTEKKLLETERIAEKFSTLFHAAPFAMALSTFPEGVLYDVNQAWLDLAGFTHKETVIGKSGVDLELISEVEPRERILDQFRQHGFVRNAEIGICTRAGAQLALLVNLDWIDIGGRKFVLSSMQDITGLKEAEEALSRSREWFRTTLGSIGDAVIATDSSGSVTFLNPMARELTGWQIEEAVGQPVQDIFRIINERTRRPAENVVERVLREGNVVNLANHTALIARDGREIPIEDSAAPIKDSAANLIGVVLVFHDVTKRRRAEDETQRLHAAIRQERDILSALVSNIPDEVWFADAQKKFTLANPSALREFALGPDSDIDIERFAASLEVSRPDGTPRPVEESPLLRSLKGEVVKNLEEIIRIPASGELRHRQVNSSPVRGADGSVIGSVSVVRDITAQKRAEEALRENRLQLDLALRSAQMGVWHLDLIENKRHFDDQVCHLLGVDPDEFSGTEEEFYKAIHPDDREMLKAVWARTIATDVTYETEYRAVWPDGSVHYLTARGKTVHDDKGRPVRIDGLIWDITERKLAMTALLESRTKLEAALASMTDAVSISDAEGRFIDFNDAFATFHRFRNKDECLKSLAEYPDILDVFTADGELAPLDQWAVPRALRGETVANTEYTLRRKDTGETWVGSYSFGPIRDKDGRIVGSVVAGRDITERKRAEEELRRAHDELELRVRERTAELVVANEDLRKQAALLNLAHDAIFVVDSADVVSFWNKGAEDLYGFTREQAIGKAACEFLQARFPESLEQVMNEVIDKGQWAGELRHTTSRGEELVVESRWALQLGEDGKPAGFLLVNRDVTDRKLAEEALRSNMARLELVNAELQEFAFVASHDLQEPLRKIQTFCDMARKRCSPLLDSTGREYLDRVVNSAGRMRQLLRDLLEFSRVAARPEPFKKIDLVKIVLEAADVFEASVKETGCQIEVQNLPSIEADETQMFGLFQNLIGNALKFRGAGTPYIKIYGKLDRKKICEIFVKDNGIGFDPRFAELIFKPFQRLHGRNEYEGTGMGLALCRKIVERHGGSIRAESEPGKGSTFIIRLPARQDRREGHTGG
jgi:PAS domain S-box-containing protein